MKKSRFTETQIVSILKEADGGAALGAQLNQPDDVLVTPDGAVLVSDFLNDRVRRVSASGGMSTIAGSGATSGPFVNNSPATAARLQVPTKLSRGVRGDVLLAGFTGVLYGIENRFAPSQVTFNVASEDGKEVYGFNDRGVHLNTTSAITGAILYTFAYNSSGTLESVVDSNGNSTRVERDSAGAPTAIIGPDGQRTELGVDANRYLSRVSNPNGEAFTLQNDPDGLLVRFETPRAHGSTAFYDELGRLRREEHDAGSFWELGRITTGSQLLSSMTSAEGREHTYLVEPLTTGDRRRVNTNPDSTQVVRIIGTSGLETESGPDGTITESRSGPDPRFGMQSPVPALVSIRTPSGLLSSVSTTRSATLSDPQNLMSHTQLQETVVRNGATYLSTYTASSRTRVATTPLGRTSTLQVRPDGKPLIANRSGLAAASFTYDSKGLLDFVTVGTGNVARVTDSEYFTTGPDAGRLRSVTDAEQRTVTFEYDLAGRVTKQTLPEARFIRYDYDENGNLRSLTPPGRTAHVFEYTTNDLEAKYTPPALGAEPTVTRYVYNLDKDLDLITRPDGQTVDFEYNAPGKKLSAMVVPNGTYTSTYKPSTGQLDVLTAPGGQALAYTYDGFLPKSESATGDVAGTVGWNYNNDFRVTSQTVNGSGISFGFDSDGLLTTAGAETLVRNPEHGLIDSTALGSVTSSHGYNTFGELTSESAAYVGSTLYQASYSVRDKLGRIKEKTETVQGETHAYVYAYDLAGRLDTVTRDGLLVSDFGYDENGNRLSHNATAASYDAQDRLLTYGTRSYTYTLNGELLTRTESGTTTTFGYDVLGNLRSVTLPGDVSIEYVIDGRNRRVGKKINGALVQGFLYGNQLEPIAELDGTGAVVAGFVYASKAHVPDHMIKGGVTYRIISDQVGSPRLVINTADGSIAQRMDHDEFGNVTIDTNPGFQPFGFAGGIYDQHTKLTRFGARDYDAETGRWTAKDPVRFDAAGSNLYGYSGDDPVNFIDLRGENPVGAAIALAADVAFQLSRPGTGVCDIDLIEAGVAAATGALFPGAGTALAEYAGVGAVSSEAIGGIIAGGTIRGSYNRAPENDGPYGRLTLPIGSLLPGVCDDPRDEEPDDGGC